VKFYLSESGAPAIMADVGYSMPPSGVYDTNLETLLGILGQ